MAQPSSAGEEARGSASAEVGRPGNAFPKRLSLDRGACDLDGGPDYVDDWMKKNLAPSVVELVRSCCTSFVRWDLLRQLHAERSAATPEDLASAVGANLAAACNELDSLVAMGLVTRRRRRGEITYRLELGSPLGQTLEAAIRAYDDSWEFRFAVVYSIVRASHHGTVLD